MSKFFDFENRNTNFRTETLAGITTFVSMVYILFVNPNILGASGIDKGAVFTATALASAFGCFVMGVLANYPIAISASLGQNAFFAYSVCIGMKVPWETALAGVFAASLIFVILTATKVRERIIDAIPADLKSAIGGGVGLFIALIGLSEGGIVTAQKDAIIGLGNLSGTTWITIFGLIVTLILMSMQVPGAIFIGIILSSVLGLGTGMIPMPHEIVSAMPSLKPTFGVAITHIGDINTVQLFVVVLTFLLVTFFDTAGTLVGLADQAGFIKNNKIPNVGKALAADSSTMLVGSVLGTSPMGAFVESSAGIAIGGRTGFTTIVVGILFILGAFFSPMLGVITSQVTAPALIIVGVLMAQSLKNVHWEKFEIAAPAFLIMVGMPFTYSIADGIALGFITYPLTMIAAKRGKEVNAMMYVLAVVFVIFLWILES
nr:NCS2 family permease [Lentilactobacillus sp. SPB1-3]